MLEVSLLVSLEFVRNVDAATQALRLSLTGSSYAGLLKRSWGVVCSLLDSKKPLPIDMLLAILDLLLLEGCSHEMTQTLLPIAIESVVFF